MQHRPRLSRSPLALSLPTLCSEAGPHLFKPLRFLGWEVSLAIMASNPAAIVKGIIQYLSPRLGLLSPSLLCLSLGWPLVSSLLCLVMRTLAFALPHSAPFCCLLLGLAMAGELKVLSNAARTTGQWVIGQPGMGKSKYLEGSALQDILAGRGVVVIDVHGDLFRNLLRHLAAEVPRRPELAERLIIVDPTDPRWTVCFNPLEAVEGFSQERLALFLSDVVVRIWKLDVTSAPRLVWLLTNTFLALADLGLALPDLRRFLLDADFRQQHLPKLKYESVRTFFEQEFPQSSGAAQQWATPALNKMGGLIFDEDVRLMLSGRPTFNFRHVLDRQSVLLVHLPKGILGEGTSALLAAFIVAQLQKAALARADAEVRPQCYMYLDEFQSYTNDNITQILSESRKYGLTLILAHQFLAQLSAEVRGAVLNTTGSIVCFRVGYRDAAQLAHEIFPAPDFLTATSRGLGLKRLAGLRIPAVETEREPLGWEGQALELSNLPPRFFWIRRRGPYAPARQRTLDLPDPALTPTLKARLSALIDAAGKRHGRLKSEARRAAAEAVERSRPLARQAEIGHDGQDPGYEDLREPRPDDLA